MSIEKDSALYRELILRSKILECCSTCRHYTLRYDDEYCLKHNKWIYGCVCKKKKRYLAHFGLSEEDLDWDISFLTKTSDEDDK